MIIMVISCSNCIEETAGKPSSMNVERSQGNAADHETEQQTQ